MAMDNQMRLIINDGYLYGRDRLYVAARPPDDDEEGSIAAIINGDTWSTLAINDLIVAAACLEADGLGFFLGHSGTILVTGKGEIVLEHLAVSEQLGPALRLKNIGGHLYACGMSGQVYFRRNDGWVTIESRLLGTHQIDFEDIDGFGPSDLYCVTSFGQVYHFDGREFRLLDFPSNRPLNSVRPTRDGRVIVCGYDGVAYRGDTRGWEYLGDQEIHRCFWDSASFREQVFLATATELLVSTPEGLRPVDVGVDGEIDFHRLHARDGVLASFGTSSILLFDGATWRRIS